MIAATKVISASFNKDKVLIMSSGKEIPRCNFWLVIMWNTPLFCFFEVDICGVGSPSYFIRKLRAHRVAVWRLLNYATLSKLCFCFHWTLELWRICNSSSLQLAMAETLPWCVYTDICISGIQWAPMKPHVVQSLQLPSQNCTQYSMNVITLKHCVIMCDHFAQHFEVCCL